MDKDRMRASINYVADRGDGIVPFVLDAQWTGADRVPTNVEICDARTLSPAPSLDREGIVLERLISGVTDYRDQGQLDALWLPAVAEMVKRVSGARWVVPWASNVRFSNRDPLSSSTQVAAPARVAHSDLSPAFDPARIGDEPVSAAAAAEIQRRLGGKAPKRWRAFNVWQQISPPPQDTPLAFCDLSTVAPEDILDGQGTLGIPGSRTFGLTFFRANPRHRWYYFSDMLPGEAVVFSAYDSEAGDVAGRVPHIAFDLPEPAANAVPRNSIEVRALAVFED
jgi:hypothetical protein